eukprot:m.43203 g.43203  ORF g.43203 m.43203 type:complete len:349 (+) comp19318_c0_seq1:220-1266(+)
MALIVAADAFEVRRQLHEIVFSHQAGSASGLVLEQCRREVGVEFPNGVLAVENFAFRGCNKRVTTISLPSIVNFLGNAAFWFCSNLTQIQLNNCRITQIGDYTFAGCCGLTSIEIPTTVVSIGVGAFEDCKGLTFIEIPNSVVHIGDSAFYACTALDWVGMSTSVVSIGNFAFAGCITLSVMEISSSVTNIGDYAFEACAFTAVEIPNSIISLGKHVFSDCHNLCLVVAPPLIVQRSRIDDVTEQRLGNGELTTILLNTKPNRLRVLQLRFWHPSNFRNHLLSQTHQDFVWTVMLIGLRLRRSHDTLSKRGHCRNRQTNSIYCAKHKQQLPPLPDEMWISILISLKRV